MPQNSRLASQFAAQEEELEQKALQVRGRTPRHASMQHHACHGSAVVAMPEDCRHAHMCIHMCAPVHLRCESRCSVWVWDGIDPLGAARLDSTGRAAPRLCMQVRKAAAKIEDKLDRVEMLQRAKLIAEKQALQRETQVRAGRRPRALRRTAVRAPQRMPAPQLAAGMLLQACGACPGLRPRWLAQSTGTAPCELA